MGFLLGFDISSNPLVRYSAYKPLKVFLRFNSNIGKVCSSEEFWYLFNNFVKVKLKNIGYNSLFSKIEKILEK